MPKEKLTNKYVLTLILPFVYFLILGVGSLLLLARNVSLAQTLQVLAFLIFVIILLIRILYNKTQVFLAKHPFFSLLFLLPVVLFIDLLVLTTGGLASQFLILTHFFSIALALLISPRISISFILATIFTIILNLFLDQTAKSLVFQAPFAAILYLIVYFALIPFSHILAKEYKSKGEWAKFLETQIITSKTQEDALLKNIADAIFILNLKYELVYLNQAAMELTGFREEIVNKPIFQIFAFKDSNGRFLQPYGLPFEQTIISKEPYLVKDILLSRRDGMYIKIDLKTLPLIGADGPIGLMVIIKDLSYKKNLFVKKEDTSIAALNRFISFLAQQRMDLVELEKLSCKNEKNKSSTESVRDKIKNLTLENEELQHLAHDFVYTLKLDSGEIGATWLFVDIGLIVENVLNTGKAKGKEIGVLVNYLKSEETEAVQPKSNVIVSNRIFPEIYVLGDMSWLNDSLKRILEIALLICDRNAQLEIGIKRENELVKVEFIFKASSFPKDQANELFEKFYGNLGNLSTLAKNSGLEGYIAKNLIDRMGGNVAIKTDADSQLLIFEITFGTGLTQ